jgi:hypothetical protein
MTKKDKKALKDIATIMIENDIVIEARLVDTKIAIALVHPSELFMPCKHELFGQQILDFLKGE